MGDLADDCYEAAMQEMFSIKEAMIKYTVNVPDQRLLMISSNLLRIIQLMNQISMSA